MFIHNREREKEGRRRRERKRERREKDGKQEQNQLVLGIVGTVPRAYHTVRSPSKLFNFF